MTSKSKAFHPLFIDSTRSLTVILHTTLVSFHPLFIDRFLDELTNEPRIEITFPSSFHWQLNKRITTTGPHHVLSILFSLTEKKSMEEIFYQLLGFPSSFHWQLGGWGAEKEETCDWYDGLSILFSLTVFIKFLYQLLQGLNHFPSSFHWQANEHMGLWIFEHNALSILFSLTGAWV